jgi:prepilin-type processing-associated H-X9-DG protein
MRRRGFTLWKLLLSLALVIVAALILLPFFLGFNDGNRHYSCTSNLKQIGLAVFQYSQDWDEKFPIVNVKDAAIDEKNPLGWADALFPYTKTQRLFWCPTQIKNDVRDENEKSPADRNYTDYFYNRRLSGIENKKLSEPNLTILGGEGNDGTDAANARYSLSSLPDAWIKDKKSPLYRHLDGANYLFSDGHVQWLPPVKITNKKPDGSTPTFAIN